MIDNTPIQVHVCDPKDGQVHKFIHSVPLEKELRGHAAAGKVLDFQQLLAKYADDYLGMTDKTRFVIQKRVAKYGKKFKCTEYWETVTMYGSYDLAAIHFHYAQATRISHRIMTL